MRDAVLWHTYGDCANYAAALGHSGAVLEVQWTADGEHLVTASTDRTAAVWDAPTASRIRRLKGHSGIVNSVAVARGDGAAVVTGSDDGTVRVRAPGRGSRRAGSRPH
jgi:Prp8 binding protein